MKLFLIIFLLQTCHRIHSQSSRDEIQKQFGYDCQFKPKIGEVFYWRILSNHNVKRPARYCKSFTYAKNMKPQRLIRGFTKLKSNETYVILTKTEDHSFHIFSWMGNQASLNDKKEASKHMIEHFWQLITYFDTESGLSVSTMSREREGRESELFQYIIISPTRMVSHNLIDYYQKRGILLMYPNMYIIRGFGSTTRMKKVPMSTLWLKNDTCMILETGYNVIGSLWVYVYCGKMVTLEAYNRTDRFVSYLRYQYENVLNKNFQIIDIKVHWQLKSLIELLEDIKYYQPNEVDNSNHHLMDAETFINERDARILLSTISSDCNSITENGMLIDDGSCDTLDGGLLKKEFTKIPLFACINVLFQTNFIFNTDSISGVYVRFGSLKLEEAVITMQHAEEYVHKLEFFTSNPIRLQIEGSDLPGTGITINAIDLNVNFIDFPLND